MHDHSEQKLINNISIINMRSRLLDLDDVGSYFVIHATL